MAEPQSGFLSGYKGNGAGRVGRWLVDKFLPGNQRGADGSLQNVGRGLVGRGASIVGSFFGGPGVGALINKGAGNLIDNGNPFSFGGNQGPIGPVGQYAFNPDTSLQVPNLGFGGGPGGMTIGNPSYGGNPFTPPMTPYTGMTDGAAFGGGPNIFNGGQGNFGQGPSPRGGYGNGVAPGTGFGVESFQNDAWGDVASGFGVGGMAGGSRDMPMVDPVSQRLKKRL